MDLDLNWRQHPDNPLVEPVWPEWLLGDPVVLPPEKSPDHCWHMFLNTVLFIYHYTSENGVRWERRRRVCRGMRAFLIEDGGEYFLFHELNSLPWKSRIVVRRSQDLWKWEPPRTVLRPSLKWERGAARVVSCPCVVRDGDIYRLYYSSGQVFLPDLGFAEQKYIGVAESDSLSGPYRKRAEPILEPDGGHPFRNLGAGAIKVYRDGENSRWVAFNNGIYRDDHGRSRSAIIAMVSDDGIDWTETGGPIIQPDSGWRRALVYQLDAVPRPGGELWIYYNSRDGWRFGVERIGLEIGSIDA